MKTSDGLFNIKYTTGTPAYRFYRKADTNQTKQGEKVFRKVISEFYKEVKNSFMTSEAGVYIKGLGYFAAWMIPKKSYAKAFINGKLVKTYNDHTNHYRFIPHLFTDFEFNKNLRFFTMDKKFARDFNRSFAERLKKGQLWKLRYTNVRNYKKQTSVKKLQKLINE